jgi:hypothetical protein
LVAGLLNKGIRSSLPLLILIFVAASIATCFAPRAIDTESYPNLFYNYFTAQLESPFVITFINYLFIAIGAALVSLIAVNQEATDKLNYFPVFLYMLICVTCVNPLQVSSQLFTNVFTLFAVFRLLDTYRRDDILDHIFEAAFWLSCATFITIPAIIGFPLFFIILLILRPFHWREWAVALLGFIAPMFIYECMAYLTDFNQWYLFSAAAHFFSGLKPPSFSEYYLPLALTLFILLVFAVIHNLMHGFGGIVKKQRAKSILLWLLLLSLLGFFSAGANSASVLLVYAFPVSLLVGDYLFRIKRLKVINTIIIILVFSALVVFLGAYQVI